MAVNPGVSATAPEYNVDVEEKANCYPANLNAAKALLEHILLNSKFTELQEACQRFNVTVQSSMIEVVELALGCISIPTTGYVSFNDPV